MAGEKEKAAKPAVAEKPAAPSGGGEGESKLLSAIAYLTCGGIIIPLILYLIKKEDKFLRFHSVQSLLLAVGAYVLWIVLGIASLVLGFVPVVGWILGVVLGLVMLVVAFAIVVAALYAAYKSFQGERYELPYIGQMARKYV